jgi:hypothetical protein
MPSTRPITKLVRDALSFQGPKKALLSQVGAALAKEPETNILIYTAYLFADLLQIYPTIMRQGRATLGQPHQQCD